MCTLWVFELSSLQEQRRTRNIQVVAFQPSGGFLVGMYTSSGIPRYAATAIGVAGAGADGIVAYCCCCCWMDAPWFSFAGVPTDLFTMRTADYRLPLCTKI